MSFVSVAPEMVSSAAGDLDDIRSALIAANAAAAPPTTAIAAPAMDQVSAAITAVLGTHAQEYQAVSAEAAQFHDGFVGALNAGAAQYVSTEAANVEQNLLNAVNPTMNPTTALLGHPLSGAAGLDGGTGSPAVTSVVGSIPARGTGDTQSVSVPVVNTDTPLGPARLRLTGTEDLTTGALALTSGTLAVPSEVSLGVDAIGPYLTTATALQSGSAAISNALNSGQPAAAANALSDTPANAVKSFLIGQEKVSESAPAPAASGCTSAGVDMPVGGWPAAPGP